MTAVRSVAAVVVLVLVGLATAAPAAAADPGHAAHAGQPVVVTQDVGPYVVRVAITPPGTGSGPVGVDVVLPEAPPGDARLTVAAVPPQGAAGGYRGDAPVRVADPGPYSFVFAAGPGRWELALELAGPAGAGTATVPFTVVAPVRSGLAVALTVALSAGGAVLAAVVVLVAARPRAGGHRRLLAGAVQALVVCATVAATVAVQLVLVPADRRTPVDPSAVGGRPAAILLVGSGGGPPVAGRAATLVLDLVDGATGRPVDDLVPHHEAFVHLVVVGPAGSFAHVHPARVAPGRYAVALPLRASGRHTAYAEIDRIGSGTQLATAELDVAPAPAPGDGPAVAPGGGPAVAPAGGGPYAALRPGTPPRAGATTAIAFAVTDRGAPVTDLEPWLGMFGHLLVRSDDGRVFAHVHEATMGAAPDGAAVAPPSGAPRGELRFAYTFPVPGRYRMWLQFRWHRTVHTVPVEIDVAPAGAAP